MKLQPMPKNRNVRTRRVLHADRGPSHFLRNLLIVCGAAIVFLLVFAFVRDGGSPVLKLSPQTGEASYATKFTVQLTSARSPLRELQIIATQDGKRVEVLSRSFPDKTLSHTETFQLPRNSGFKQGSIELSISARSHALLSFLGRGKTSVTEKLALDFTPPQISMTPEIHNVYQGGAAAVAFTVSKPVLRVGVSVGRYFFPAYPQGGKNAYVCYFGMPYDMPTTDFKPRVVAEDKAGNEAVQYINALGIARNFKADSLEVPDSFLDSKMGQYSAMYPELKTPVEIYKRVNSELRKQNVADLLKIGLDTAPTQLWSGAFLRLPNAAGRAGFGDQRDYYYNGEKIDHETHLGVDLASVAGAAVPAANAGRVVMAQFYGIYGNCIILDHGQGLQSLYSHLSKFEVAKGDTVKKGQIIARTGATGLAGGDHLHFGMIVSGLQVSPVEWWDEHWIHDNILKHIGQ